MYNLFISSCFFHSLCLSNASNAWHAVRSDRPGGWSSKGQPVDQLHNAFRRQLQIAGAEDLKYFSDLALRPWFRDLSLTKSGQAKRTALITGRLLENSLKAWRQVSPQCFSAAWATCGYVSKNDSVDLQKAAMALDPSGLFQAMGAEDFAQVKHAKIPCWQVQKEDGTWANMPSSIANL